jgi:hypothetical protein
VEFLIQLVDGGITNISTDTYSYSGCETCDWGSQYINEFEVTLTTREVKVEVNQMYSYELSEDYLMKLFITNIDAIRQMTEVEFVIWLDTKLKEDIEPIVEELKFETKEC